MQKNRIYKYLAWLLIFVFVCSAVFVSAGNVKAAGKRNIKSVVVRVDGKKATKKTVTLRKGKKTTLEVSASPGKAKERVTYTSSKKSVATVSKEGRVTAKKAGMTKIEITVSGKGYKKKTTWVKIRVVNSKDTTTGNVLIAYFSLSENTSSSKKEQSSSLDAVSSASVVTDGESAYGNTEYIAKMIQNKTGGTLYQIQTKETYSTDFEHVVDQNHTEMNTSYLPELKDNYLDISQYDIVFIGYPVWASTIPRAIHSFLNQYDLSGKTVIPFCTHNGYGSGNSYRTIAGLCQDATNLDGFAVAATDIKEAESSVESWLNGLNLSFQKVKK